jgi:hypothetical protein
MPVTSHTHICTNIYAIQLVQLNGTSPDHIQTAEINENPSYNVFLTKQANLASDIPCVFKNYVTQPKISNTMSKSQLKLR